MMFGESRKHLQSLKKLTFDFFFQENFFEKVYLFSWEEISIIWEESLEKSSERNKDQQKE